MENRRRILPVLVVLFYMTFSLRSLLTRFWIERRCARALRVYLAMQSEYWFTLEIRCRVRPVLGVE